MTKQDLALFEQWTTLDDRTLTKNPVSIRLPIHLMARLNALVDVFPNRSRSDFMVDLMKAALEVFEQDTFPTDDYPDCKATGVPSLEHVLGMAYRESSNKHYKKLSKDLGMPNAQSLFPAKASKANGG